MNDRNGNKITFSYNAGRVATITDGEDANGIVAAGYYEDALDRPTKVIRAANQTSTSIKNQTVFSYDDPNRTVTSTSDLTSFNDGGLVSKVLYDNLGRTFESRQYEGETNYIITKRNYDALGRAYQISNPYRPWQSETAVWMTTTFDALGRTLTATTPDNAVVTTSYYGNTVTATDQAGKSRKSVSDALGRLTSVYEDPSGLNYQTSYAYDVLNNLTTVTQGVQTRTFVYDSLKRLTSATNPESGAVSYTYDNNGNMLTRLDARNVTTTIAYDVLNRPTSKSYNDSPQTPTVNFYYDAQTLPSGAPTFDRGYATGALVAVTYGGTSAGTYRGYDVLGRVVRQYQRTDSVNYLTEASYSVSSMTSETYPSVPGYGDRRTVSYTPDAAGRLSSLNSNATTYAPAASVSSIGYTSHNGLKTETYGNGLIHALTYNNRLQPTEIKLGTSGNPTSVLSLVYSYGTTTNNGNVQSITYNGGGLNYTQSFTYDALNRLANATETSGGNTSWSQTNGYDRYGNRWIDLGGGNQSLYFTANTNRITGWSYDAAGNLLNDGVHAYTFDAENRISKVDTVTAYTYDGEGQRVKKLVGENTRFVYGIGGQLSMEFEGSTGNLKKEYIYGGATTITIDSNSKSSPGTQYLTTDNLGSPRVITNSNGTVTARRDYMPFGEEVFAGTGGRTTNMGFSAGGADTNRKKFTGYERDTETGLDFAQARYHASTQGRFTSPDPLQSSAKTLNPQSFNRYAYVGNNPMVFTDPSGMATGPARLTPNLAIVQSSRLGPDDLQAVAEGPNVSASIEWHEAISGGEIQNPPHGDTQTGQGEHESTPVSAADLQIYGDRVRLTLANPQCSDFIAQILDETKAITGRGSKEIMATFSEIKFFWKAAEGGHGGEAYHIHGQPAADIDNKVKTEAFINAGRSQALIRLTTAVFLAETLHFVAEGTMYTEGVMAQATNNVLVRKGFAQQTFDIRDRTMTNIIQASNYWHPFVMSRCPGRP